MEEILIIKNFGPIKSVELKLKQFTILIGEQATGKSTVAKVLAVCRYFSYLLPSKINVIDFFEQGLKAWGLFEHVQFDKTYIEYTCDDYSFKAKSILKEDYDPGSNETTAYPVFNSMITPLSEKFSNLLFELEKIIPSRGRQYNLNTGNWNIPTSFYQNDVASVMHNPFFLPVERGLQSVFSLGKSTIQNISDSLFNQLAKLDQIARTFRELTFIQPLGIEYKNENGRGLIKLKNDTFFSLYNGASGYQSTIPVVLSVDYYNKGKKGKTFIVEEPELNLFPLAQNELMKYLVNESIIHNHQVLLTTHSPYILTSLNNLLYAFKVGQEHEEEVSAIVEKKYWLNPDDISAYRLLPDGTGKDIIDDEIHQIDVGEIDGISRDLNRIWDKISNVKYSSVGES